MNNMNRASIKKTKRFGTFEAGSWLAVLSQRPHHKWGNMASGFTEVGSDLTRQSCNLQPVVEHKTSTSVNITRGTSWGTLPNSAFPFDRFFAPLPLVVSAGILWLSTWILVPRHWAHVQTPRKEREAFTPPLNKETTLTSSLTLWGFHSSPFCCRVSLKFGGREYSGNCNGSQDRAPCTGSRADDFSSSFNRNTGQTQHLWLPSLGVWAALIATSEVWNHCTQLSCGAYRWANDFPILRTLRCQHQWKCRILTIRGDLSVGTQRKLMDYGPKFQLNWSALV